MKIDIRNLLFQLLPVSRRQPNRINVLESLIDLVAVNNEYALWQQKYKRILYANAQVIKLQTYLRDVFKCPDIFIKERVSGRMRVALAIEKINSELIFGLRSENESKQYLQINIEIENINNANYNIVYPSKISTELLIIEIDRFNPALKKYQLKETYE